jgi:hypothetical protein
VAAPLLGLASLIGREYANTMPTDRERNDILKLVSPHTYYGNQLIEYLANKVDPELGFGLKTARLETDSDATYPYATQMSQDEYDRQMLDLSARTNTPENQTRFENFVRDDTYGTINPFSNRFVGPNPEDVDVSRLYESVLPAEIGQLPVESSFTPAQLDALRERIYGPVQDVGPPQEIENPLGPGGGYMPRGNDKNNFMPEGGLADIEQYLRGGLTGYRR